MRQIRQASSSASSVSSSSRISRTLYRQIIQWCNTTDPQVPLQFPPIHITSPEQVDAYRLELLALQQDAASSSNDDDDDDAIAVNRARRCLPAHTEIHRTSLTVPIHSVHDLRNFVRALYRLNQQEPFDLNHDKQRISVAFEALKSLNELTGRIQATKERRRRHEQRNNAELGVVLYRVGQVVQHQQDRWRGVIAGWERNDPGAISSEDVSLSSNKTSLTSKDYSGLMSETNFVRYNIILDEGDAHMMVSSSGWQRAVQSDLIPLAESSSSDEQQQQGRYLTRIRSRFVNDFFVRYDQTASCFVPNKSLAYEYPEDILESVPLQTTLSPEEIQLCHDVVMNVQELASRLERVILDETSCAKARGLSLLSTLETRFADLSTGKNVIPLKTRLSSSTSSSSDANDPLSTRSPISDLTRAIHHLRVLSNTCMEVFDIMLRRRQALQSQANLRFSLGDVVRHKVFSFRGVVVAWDPTPTVDVTSWDGLQHVENPMNKPFYHVIPDQSDCLTAFGAPRRFRYVCEDNLEACPHDQRNLDVDLGLDWTRDSASNQYVPSMELRFKYGEQIDDGGITERCMTVIQNELNAWQIATREGKAVEGCQSVLSICHLFQLLRLVDNFDDAAVVQGLIKDMRKAYPEIELRWKLEAGTSELLRGNGDEALAIYGSIIDEIGKSQSSTTSYPEVYNKKGTCEFMLGRLDDSIVSTKKVLELDPLHSHAFNGLGLIHFEKKEYREAADLFQKSIEMDPWSPVSSKLSLCLDLMNQMVHEDEIPF